MPQSNTMEACRGAILSAIPAIDGDIFQYVTDILSTSSDDFGSADELWEAVGEVLNEADASKSEDDVKDLCKSLFGLMHPNVSSLSASASATSLSSCSSSSSLHRVLDAPVSLNQLVDVGSDQQAQSIWIQKNEDNTKVDNKKLVKAEQLLAKKQEKKEAAAATAGPDSNRFKLNEASASQSISRKDAKAEQSGSNNTKDVRIENFDVSFGEKVLLKGADLTLIYGRRYGMVGRNGLGKSTLLKMISGGHLVIPGHISILHVEQEVTGDDTEALQSVLESDEVREGLIQEEKNINKLISEGNADASLSTRLSEVYAELQAVDADSAPARASVILFGLGFTAEEQKRATKTFSGGWRMRLALARALFRRPDLLLLDEPTNMLDMQAIIWLERYLQKWPSTLLVVSHDRLFLEEVPTDILHLHTCRIDTYRGNYSDFENTMTERHKSQQREYDAQMELRKHMQEFIDKFRYNAKRASLVQSRIKQLEKLPELKPVEKETEVTLRFPDVEKLSPPILMLSNVSFAYDGKNNVFQNVDLSGTMESRICIVGENGAGKTTLLKLVMGLLSPTAGDRSCHRNLKFGYFAQHHVDQLDVSLCSVELMQREFPGKKVEDYRRQLGSFGVSGELALQQIASLSGGQKSRVAFSVMCAHNPNFLILDEPTNHLDIQTIEALGHAINKYKGGVIVVSHDERLIRMVCKELWVCSRGKVYSMEGGFEQYRAMIEKEIVL